MTKNEEGIYSVTLPLPRGFHQYKFKVDDNWTYSKKQPKFEDNGNVNNFIDTTDYDNLNEDNNEGENDIKEEATNEEKDEKDDIEKSKEEEVEKIEEKKQEEKNNIKTKEKKKSKLDNTEAEVEEEVKKGNNIKSELDKRNSLHFLNSQNQYSIYYPLRAEFSKKPSALPGLFKTYYILNEKKNKKIAERKFSQIEYIDSSNNSIQEGISESQSQGSQSLNNSLYFINETNPYVKFQNLYHIHSNHLHSKEAFHIQNTITSIISRYRFKFSTYIYYKENKPTKVKNNWKKHSQTFRIKRGVSRK
jgi:hypothetical protein